MAYQSKASKLMRASYRYTHKLYSTTIEYKKMPNGLTVAVPTRSEEPRWCALYQTSMTSTTGINLYNASYDFQIAVRKIANDPFDSFTLDTKAIYQFDDDTTTKYTIKNISRSTEPLGYHILTLTSHAQA